MTTSPELQEKRLGYLIISEARSFLRGVVVAPLVILNGAAILMATITVWSLFEPGLKLPMFLTFIVPESFTVDSVAILKIWGVLSLGLYFVQKIFFTLTNRETTLSYRHKMVLQSVVLTTLYTLILAAASMRIGWFAHGENVTLVMFVLFVVTLITSLITLTLVKLLDSIKAVSR